jgi:prophage antirepressor-like protein
MQAVIVNLDEDDRNTIGESTKHLPDRCLASNSKNTIYINESGLYSLILRSEKPEAKTFKKWVCSEVLPSIRKTDGKLCGIPTTTATTTSNHQYV